MSITNSYTHRKVAENAGKGCEICYRATASVLVAPENKDFFYVCPSHLKDKNFCTPIIDHAAIEARNKKEMDEEIARVKQEYEERQKKKKEKEDKESKDATEKDKDTDKEKEKETDPEKKDDKSSQSKEKAKSEASTPKHDEEPRVFSLHKNFFGMRLEKKRQIEVAKRNRERLAQPNFFPSVPQGAPGASGATEK